MVLNERSEVKLIGVNEDLVAVVRRAAEITKLDFIVTEGLRTPERQAQLVKAGASHTMHSNHLVGRAVDLAPVVDGEVRWDWPLFDRLANVMKTAAVSVGVQIVWGGDWVSFPDGPHFELAQTA